MSLRHVARLTTYLDLVSVFKIKELVQLYIVSYISDRLISKLGHLASFVYNHNAMAHVTGPQNHAKITLIRKYIYPYDLGCHARCKDSITINKA
jgi:hypothetical protein